MRIRPTVQGAAVVLENRTGRILAMAGGFSFPVSQLNRATQSRRQPGSSFKPVVYLAALASGTQPNAMIDDGPITLPPIGYRHSIYRESTDYKDWWSPKNYDSGYGGTMTLRRALENSKNLATAHLLQGGIAGSAPESLDKICAVAKEAQLYQICERYYPFILGAQPVRPLDMAVLYASIANEGFRPTPHVIELIEREGQTVYRAQPKLTALAGVDRPAAFQLRTILQGVLARGTARSIGHLSSFVGGKTGTSDEENDAWFVGFSNDVTIAVWVGYDNRRGKRTLGGGQTGGKVAVPIFEPIMQAVWQHHAPKTALRGPSPEASRNLVAMQIDVNSGYRAGSYNRRALLQRRAHLHGRAHREPQHRRVHRILPNRFERPHDAVAADDLARQLVFRERPRTVEQFTVQRPVPDVPQRPAVQPVLRDAERGPIPRHAAEQRAELGRPARDTRRTTAAARPLAGLRQPAAAPGLLRRLRVNPLKRTSPRASCGSSGVFPGGVADKQQQLVHSTTLVARASIDGGIVRPSARAVFKLIANSNLVDCITGRLAGASPLRMRPV